FFELANNSSFRCKPEIPYHLLRNRAGALSALPPQQIDKGSSNNTHGIEPAVLEEASVFDCEYCIAQDLGNILILDQPSLFPGLVKQIGNQQRLDFVRVEGIVGRQRN